VRIRRSETLPTSWSDRDSTRHSPRLVALSVVIVLVCGLLSLVGRTSATTTSITDASTRSAFDARLRRLGADPAILGAAQHRLSFAAHDPAALVSSAQTSPETPQEVRSVLARDVDEVVIVDWLVSFGALGAWTAYDPSSTEAVNIPVSDIPSLFAHPPFELGVYRLRDRRHLMLVRPIVVGDRAVGAVGFILTQTHADPTLAAEAVPLE
jgi:hypothetical protein